MYYIITNMEKGQSLLDDDVFCVISHCGYQKVLEDIQYDLMTYYAFYNYKDVKVAIFKDSEFNKSNEYKYLERFRPNLDNVVRFFNQGEKDVNCFNSSLPLTERIATFEKIEERIKQLKLNKYINELNW